MLKSAIGAPVFHFAHTKLLGLRWRCRQKEHSGGRGEGSWSYFIMIASCIYHFLYPYVKVLIFPIIAFQVNFILESSTFVNWYYIVATEDQTKINDVKSFHDSLDLGLSITCTRMVLAFAGRFNACFSYICHDIFFHI